MRIKVLAFAVWVVLAISVLAIAASNGVKDKDKDAPAAAPTNTAAQDDPMRLEGEKAYHANCGRCHMAPPKFAPRMMATIVRHMRVRATITDQEMRSILHYMTQ